MGGFISVAVAMPAKGVEKNMSEINLKKVIGWRKQTFGGAMEWVDWLINEVKSMKCEECDGAGFYQESHDGIMAVGGPCDECNGTGLKHNIK